MRTAIDVAVIISSNNHSFNLWWITTDEPYAFQIGKEYRSFYATTDYFAKRPDTGRFLVHWVDPSEHSNVLVEAMDGWCAMDGHAVLP